MARHAPSTGVRQRRTPGWLLLVIAVLLVAVGGLVLFNVNYTQAAVRANAHKFCSLLSGVKSGPPATTAYGKHQQAIIAQLYIDLGCPGIHGLS